MRDCVRFIVDTFTDTLDPTLFAPPVDTLNVSQWVANCKNVKNCEKISELSIENAEIMGNCP